MRKPGFCIDCWVDGRGHRVDATRTLDGDDLCEAHYQRQAGAPAETLKPAPPPPAPPVVVCSRGCGKPTHAGRCAGSNGRPPKVCEAAAPDQGTAPKAMSAPHPLAPPQAPVELAAPGRLVTKADAPGWDVVTVEVEGTQGARRTRERAGAMDRLVAKAVRLEDIPKAEAVRKSSGRMGELWERLLVLPRDTPALEVVNRDIPHAGATLRGLRRRSKAEGLTVFCLRVGKLLYCSLSNFPGAA